MGCNFYTLDGKHIGKRYAAGIWCWDCKMPMFREKGDHELKGPESYSDRYEHYDACWLCGNKRPDRALTFNPAFREMGFDTNEPQEHKGIDGASGFIWSIGDPETEKTKLGKTKKDILQALKRYRTVKDEYGRKITTKEFLAIFRDVIKEEFSRGEFS